MAALAAAVGAAPSAVALEGAASLGGPLCTPLSAGGLDGLGWPPSTPAGAARGRAREPLAMEGGDEVPPGMGRTSKGYARTIPVFFHVISAGPTAAEGNVGRAQLEAQIQVLNRAYAGRYGGVRTPFSFVLADVTRTRNAAWFSMGYGSQEERRAKSALRRGGADALNVYSTDGAGDTLLGWATFPSRYAAQPWKDGIVVHHGSLPGGFIEGFNLGHTATHETGHWLGLFHTFQNRCSARGDRVADTPPERTPSSGCPEGKDTCPDPGLDPIHNYMDYSDDRCYTEFTSGQSDRATAQFVHFREG